MFDIFQKLGGEQTALSIIAVEMGKPVSPILVRKWKSLGSIPAIRAVILLDECGRRGITANYQQDCTAQREAAQ